jgi:hypothetical protein
VGAPSIRMRLRMRLPYMIPMIQDNLRCLQQLQKDVHSLGRGFAT